MPRILVAMDRTEGSRRAAAFVDRFVAGMDVAVTAVNVARNPVDTVPPVAFGGVFPWGPAGPNMAAGDRATWEQDMVREQQAGEAVALVQAPADAEVEVVFAKRSKRSCAPATTRTPTSSWWGPTTKDSCSVCSADRCLRSWRARHCGRC
jgi:nucleotide-binding universal stress UspA family protein